MRIMVIGCVVAALAVAICLGGCGESQTPPAVLAAQTYLNDLAEGNYPGACALLDGRARTALNGRARAALPRRAGRRVSCPRAFTRCLPDNAQVPKRDQSQLLFANVQVSIHGESAAAAVGGTPVARAVRHVTLAKQGRHWKLTSYGQGLTRCRPRTRRPAKTGTR